MSKIYLNAGHGGSDSGAPGVNGRLEKNETLRMALAVKPLLESAGHTVIMERETDIYISVTDIASLANKSGANLFVALHLNASDSKGHGAECLVCSGCSSTSTKLAGEIAKRVCALGLTMREPTTGGVKTQDNRTYVLSNTNMPAVTVEMCFIDNAADMALYDSQFSNIAKAIANGICAVAGGAVAAMSTAPKAPDGSAQMAFKVSKILKKE